MLATICKWIFRLSLCLWLATFLLLNHLPLPSEINPESYQEPLQQSLHSESFNITYKNQTSKIVPVATYELHGLVVSHNEPSKWYKFDLSHDEKSLNTRDLCIIWGDNIKSGDYKKISFHNDDYSCAFQWKESVAFNLNQVSNNHLITDSEKIRKHIDEINIGDEIIIKGRLVNYSEERWNGAFRNTSTTRTDTGMGACEIIYVEDLQIIKSHNYLWALLHAIFFYALIASLIMRFVLFFRRDK